MRRLVLGLASASFTIAALLFAAAGNAAPPSSASVVAKIVAAYGGAPVLAAIKTTSEELSLSIQGQDGTSKTTQELPNKFLQVLTIPAYRVNITTGFDGTNGWIMDSYGHVKALSGDQLATVRCQASNPIFSLLNTGSSSMATAVQPNQTIDGKSYVVLLVSQKDCPSTTLYVDPKTYLIARVSNAQQTVDLSDYTTGPLGEKYPKSLVITSGMGSFLATITSVKDNQPVDDAIFAMPAVPSPSPGASALPASSASPASQVTPASLVSPAPSVSPAPAASASPTP